MTIFISGKSWSYISVSKSSVPENIAVQKDPSLDNTLLHEDSHSSIDLVISSFPIKHPSNSLTFS